jgi:hypothetical protein
MTAITSTVSMTISNTENLSLGKAITIGSTPIHSLLELRQYLPILAECRVILLYLYQVGTQKVQDTAIAGWEIGAIAT